MLGAPVGATRKRLFTVVSHPPMGAVAISMDRDAHLCRLSGTSEGKSSYSSKRNPSQTEAHKKPPDRGWTRTESPVAQEIAKASLKQSRMGYAALVHLLSAARATDLRP
jgi:hypothetical protein